ncbi:MAG: hypothetical protein LBL87_05800 [Ruminococcus sp.]|jgi:hypothetical protein|nr:hypothetical protein [Ruminococcus sp.]
MNKQLSPDEIARYKEEMLKMYQNVGNEKNSSKGNSVAAASKPDVLREANENVLRGHNSADHSHLQVISSKTPTAQKFDLVDSSQFEKGSPADAEPEYTGRTARLQTPDTGAIAAPGGAEAIAPVPPPPAGGTYYPDTGGIGVPNFPGIVSTGPAAAPTGGARPPVTPPRPPAGIQTPDTGYIEAPEFAEDEMGTGYLRVQVHTANRAIPVPDAMLIITEETPLGRKLVKMSITDENGYSDLIPLEVPILPLEEFPNPEQKPYRDYRLSAFADGYYIVPRIEVPIFANVKSLQSVEMVPLAENTSPLSLFPSSTSESDTSITSIEFEQT